MPEKVSLLTEEQAAVPASTRRWSHEPRAICRMILLAASLAILSPIFFIYPATGRQFLSRKPIVATGRCSSYLQDGAARD